MGRIRIKNFGPIKEGYLENNGWLEIKKVTVFIGNQGSGKSTIAKVVSTLTWLEKAINRGDIDINRISHNEFYKFFKYQRIHNYFRDNTEIEYIGDKMFLNYKKNLPYPSIEILNNTPFNVPKIMYVPSERNFLSTVKNAYGLKNLPDTLYTFAEELRKGQQTLNNNLLQLPIGNLEYKYDSEKDNSYLIGKDYELDMVESSSGYQSFVPLFLVTKFLTDELLKGENISREQLNIEQSVRRNKEIADIMFDKSLNEDSKIIKIKEIDEKYLNTCFINIIEEPEQNLFPSTQQKMIYNLLAFNNIIENNKLVITTHSPYLINYLTLSIKAGILKSKLNNNQKDKLNKVVPLESCILPDEIAIYELNEIDGSLISLGNYEGIPSDKNYLNIQLGLSNKLYDSLLDIEEEI
jgi:predicted ATPase